MDWNLAVEKNRTALLAIVAQLLALAGLQGENAPRRFSKKVHRAILYVLRPAESAVRRLIIIAARGMSVPGARAETSMPDFKILSQNSGSHRGTFRLIDPRKRFEFDKGRDFAKAIPRISIPGIMDPLFQCKANLKSGGMNATPLLRRLQALDAALGDLPKQARRLARYESRRQSCAIDKPAKMSVLRPGFPPGHRKRKNHEIDHILTECDILARDHLVDARIRGPACVVGQY